MGARGDKLNAAAFPDSAQRRVLASMDRDSREMWERSEEARDAYVLIRDVKDSGTNGGTFTQAAWQTRDLTEIKEDPRGLCVLNDNRIKLKAGAYRVEISCPAMDVGDHQARLRDVTNGATLLLGTSEYASAAGTYATSRSVIKGRITLDGDQLLEIQHRCETTSSGTYGFGDAGGLGDEIYTLGEFFKVG